jgi:sulfonate transport system ATP-binding protein
VAEAVALADRVVLIEDGRIALDERIDLPRPRHRGSPAFARLEEAILNRVMQRKIDPEALPDVQTHTAWASPWRGVSATAVRWAV